MNIKKIISIIFYKVFCSHDWETKERMQYHQPPFYGASEQVKLKCILVCKKCGKIEKISFD